MGRHVASHPLPIPPPHTCHLSCSFHHQNSDRCYGRPRIWAPTPIPVNQALLGLCLRLFLSLLVCFSWSRPFFGLTFLPSLFFLLFRARGLQAQDSRPGSRKCQPVALQSPGQPLPLSTLRRELDSCIRGQPGEEGELIAAGVPFDSSWSSDPGTLSVCPTPGLPSQVSGHFSGTSF